MRPDDFERADIIPRDLIQWRVVRRALIASPIRPVRDRTVVDDLEVIPTTNQSNEQHQKTQYPWSDRHEPKWHTNADSIDTLHRE
jgi:hypothetical protein